MVPRGGKREGAGRPSGSGQYSEPTQAIRVPCSLVDSVRKFAQAKGYRIPLYGAKVAAGFPSPADDFIEGHLDLNEHLIEHPAATFFVRATGYSMIGAGIYPGDILVVDRSIEARHDKVIIAAVNGELIVKRLHHKNNEFKLCSENPDYPEILLEKQEELHVWGVVTNVIHSLG